MKIYRAGRAPTLGRNARSDERLEQIRHLRGLGTGEVDFLILLSPWKRKEGRRHRDGIMMIAGYR